MIYDDLLKKTRAALQKKTCNRAIISLRSGVTYNIVANIYSSRTKRPHQVDLEAVLKACHDFDRFISGK